MFYEAARVHATVFKRRADNVIEACREGSALCRPRKRRAPPTNQGRQRRGHARAQGRAGRVNVCNVWAHPRVQLRHGPHKTFEELLLLQAASTSTVAVTPADLVVARERDLGRPAAPVAPTMVDQRLQRACGPGRASDASSSVRVCREHVSRHVDTCRSRA